MQYQQMMQQQQMNQGQQMHKPDEKVYVQNNQDVFTSLPQNIMNLEQQEQQNDDDSNVQMSEQQQMLPFTSLMPSLASLYQLPFFGMPQ